ncbi:PepSY-associated TM helix domain-containing protein [Achromobacter sp. NPDC008082]|uniref:PepSY-associated TM helix domain-containing protein n=1 Tax=Achromobacter sp. NPDC008082 TaxID=3363888 RepID=UPI0036EE233C
MAFICMTGTLAVIATELDWLVQPAMRVEPASRHASWGDMAQAAQAAYPGWTLLSITAPHASRFAAQALMRTPQGQQRFVWIDPYRAAVTGDTSWFSMQRWLRNTHRHLFLPTRYGVPLVSALSIPLTLLIVTGLVIYKRWWRGFLAWPRRGKRRLMWGDVHRLLAVWSLWFAVVIAVSGLWYLIESLGGHAPPLPAITAKDAPRAAAPFNAQTLDSAIARIRQQWPELDIRVLRLEADGRAGQVEGQTAAWLVRDRANAIRLPLEQGEPARRSAADLSVHQRISELADPIHFGSFGPWPVRVIWFLFGAALTALCLTGAYLYGLRIAGGSAAVRAKAGHGGAPATPVREAWAGMWPWRWLWLALLLLSQGLFVGEAMGWVHLFG